MSQYFCDINIYNRNKDSVVKDNCFIRDKSLWVSSTINIDLNSIDLNRFVTVWFQRFKRQENHCHLGMRSSGCLNRDSDILTINHAVLLHYIHQYTFKKKSIYTLVDRTFWYKYLVKKIYIYWFWNETDTFLIVFMHIFTRSSETMTSLLLGQIQ